MVLMSKIGNPPASPFVAADLAGRWRVYLQRVESSKTAGGTWQVGQTTFGAAGAFVSGALTAADSTVTTLTTGAVLVSANGSVTGTFSAGPGGLADLYTVTGTMRAAKDLITGVVTARVDGRTKTFHGVVTMVRDVTLFDLAQGTYNVTEGGSVTVTVLRTGNLAGTATVQYTAGGGTAPPADYPPTSGTLTFGSGVGSATFSVKSNANTLVDGNRTVNLVLSNPTGTGALLGTTVQATLNILDEDKAGTVKLSAATYSVAEAGKNATIMIQRAGGTASGVVVQYQTSNGTAQAGTDYTATNGSVTFGSAETTKTVLVPITDTAIVDGSRTFTFALVGATPPSTVIGAPSSSVVTIGDNDVAGTVQFKLAAYTVDETAGTAQITVTRSGGSAGGVRVDFATADGTATAGADYTATSGTLTFQLGNTSATFSIPILADTLVEGDETVLLTLSNPQGGATLGAQKTAVLTIKDAQKGVQFSAPGYTATEATASATITVSRTGPTLEIATVRYSTSDGTAKAGVNYKPASGTLTFGIGVTKATFTVPLLGDKLVKGPQTVLLLLSSPSSTALGPLSSAVLTIGDVDTGGTIKLGASAFSIAEAAGSAVITVSRAGGTAGGVTVDFATADQPCAVPPCPGKAQGGFDYQALSGTVTFGVGDTMKTILIPVTNDPQVNGNRTFLVGLSNPSTGATLGTPNSAVVTIVNDDQAGVIQFSSGTYQATEPAAVSTTATITVTRTGTSLGAATVQFATGLGTATAGVSYVPTATTLVFGQGETSKPVPVPILPNPAATGNQTVPLMLSNPGGGATLGNPAAAMLTIIDSVQSARFSSATYSVTEGSPGAITVLRGGSSTGTLKVDYATSDVTAHQPGDYKSTSGTLTFNAGVTSLTFMVPTVNTLLADGNRDLKLTLTSNAGSLLASPSVATLTILDNDASGTFQFASPAYTTTEGGVAPQITVTRTGGSGGQVLVRWTATGGTATGGATPATPGADYAPTTGVLTFGPGVTSLKVPLTIVNDTLAENAETVDLGLTLEPPAPVDAAIVGGPTTLTILDNDNGGTIQFALATVTVAENVAGGKVNLVVNRAGTSLASGIMVGYLATGDTGAITLAPGTLTFAAGQGSAMIPVTILANALAEPDRTVVVTLSNPQSAGGATGANAPVLGATASTTLKIVDDEPRVQFSTPGFVVTEGGVATITVTRTGSLTGQITVNYATSDGSGTAGTNYLTASGTLTFPTGVAGRTFGVTTIDDTVATGSRTVGLTLSSPAGASIGATNPATLTIQDKQSAGTIQFAASTATVVEGLPGDPGRTVHITVTRTGANLVGPVTVGWSATGGTATSPADFTPSSGTLTFEAGVASQGFDIVAVDDAIAEGTETIVLGLGAPTGGAVLGSPSQMTVYIIDAQQSVAFSNASYAVGETTPQAVITLVRLGVPTGAVTVTATTVPAVVLPGQQQAQAGDDYVNTSTVVTFAVGEIVKTFNVPILTGNASVRNGNRIVGLQLSSPVNAALLGAGTATLTILDFRPDLVIASVGTPPSTLTGKTLSTPTTVRNLGQVASPTFRVGVFMAKDTGLPNDALAGAGSLVAQQDVPSLAAGATAALPTQVAIADDLPPGNYFVSAVANFNQSVIEADPNNNGLSSAPSVLKVSSNLSKFQTANANFNLGNAGGGGSSSLGAPQVVPPGTCDVSGSVNLSGSFTITSQQQDTANGFADLSGIIAGGALDGLPVRFVINFTGTGDTSGNITANLTSIVVSGAFSATGTGTPPGTFTGSLTGATLTGNATGTIHTGGGGDCSFTGPLTAVAKTSFTFRFGTQVPVGNFGFGTTPDNVVMPVMAVGYGARFKVMFDTNFPDPSTVRFTGPAGSGITGVPADPSESHGDDNGSEFSYALPPHAGVAPGGTWSVLYKGIARLFTVPSFDANRSLAVIFPTVTITSGNLTRVDWVYQDTLGNRLPGPPSFMSGLRLQVQLNQPVSNPPESDDLPPTVTSFDFAANGITPPVWSQVNALVFQYSDLLGNRYELDYAKLFATQLQARLENQYAGFLPTGAAGSRERIINAFVNVPFLSVDDTPCSDTILNPPPYFVSIQNLGTPAPGFLPYDNPTCLDRTSTTFFPGAAFPADIFSRRDNLDTIAGSPLPTLMAGTAFRFVITPSDTAIGPQTVLTPLANAEANPATDFVSIPNPSTPTLKPAGFRLTDAKLGQNLTVSWTLPTSFPIASVQLTAFVTADPPTGGQAQPAFTIPPFSCNPSSIDLPTTAKSGTLKFPTTCFGLPITQAQFCVFITGPSPENKTTTACWFFE
jgi:hypothetical protein